MNFKTMSDVDGSVLGLTSVEAIKKESVNGSFGMIVYLKSGSTVTLFYVDAAARDAKYAELLADLNAIG